MWNIIKQLEECAQDLTSIPDFQQTIKRKFVPLLNGRIIQNEIFHTILINIITKQINVRRTTWRFHFKIISITGIWYKLFTLCLYIPIFILQKSIYSYSIITRMLVWHWYIDRQEAANQWGSPLKLFYSGTVLKIDGRT